MSGMEHWVLADKLLSQNILCAEKYQEIIDRSTGLANRDRLNSIMLAVQNAAKHDRTVLQTFIDVLTNIGGKLALSLAIELEELRTNHKCKFLIRLDILSNLFQLTCCVCNPFFKIDEESLSPLLLN